MHLMGLHASLRIRNACRYMQNISIRKIDMTKFMLTMLQHPQVQEQAQAEIDAAVGFQICRVGLYMR